MRIVSSGLVLVAALCMFAAFLASGANSKSDPHGLLLVVNKSDQTLGIIDPESGRQIAAVPVGGTGHEVAASRDGRTAWVPIYGNSGVGQPGTDDRAVRLIDLRSHTRIAQIDLGGPSRPHCAVFGPKDGRLYVTAELTRSIKVIDPGRRAVVDSIPTGEPESHMLAISSNGERGYTSNVGSGTVSAIDLRTKKVLTVIPVAKVVQRIAISVDDRWVFTADQAKPQIVVIDTHTNEIKSWVTLSYLGFGMTPTHDGRYLLITHPSSDSVSILNLDSMKIEREIRVPADPQEILVRPDDRVAYVSCDQSKKVAEIDLAFWKITRLIDVGAGADGLAWAATTDQ